MVAECDVHLRVEARNDRCRDVEHVHPDLGWSRLCVDADGHGFCHGVHVGLHGVCGHCSCGLRRHHPHSHPNNHGQRNGRVSVACLNRIVADGRVTLISLGSVLNDYVVVLSYTARHKVRLPCDRERSGVHHPSRCDGFANRVHIGDRHERVHCPRRALTREELADAVNVDWRLVSSTAVEIVRVC